MKRFAANPGDEEAIAVLRNAGMPTYGVMGLFIKEEDEFAHGLNERVQVDVFFGALGYWHDLLTDLAGS